MWWMDVACLANPIMQRVMNSTFRGGFIGNPVHTAFSNLDANTVLLAIPEITLRDRASSFLRESNFKRILWRT